MADHESPEPTHSRSSHSKIDTGVLNAVSAALGKLRFGLIQLTVHEGRVVQLDVTERQRFP